MGGWQDLGLEEPSECEDPQAIWDPYSDSDSHSDSDKEEGESGSEGLSSVNSEGAASSVEEQPVKRYCTDRALGRGQI